MRQSGSRGTLTKQCSGAATRASSASASRGPLEVLEHLERADADRTSRPRTAARRRSDVERETARPSRRRHSAVAGRRHAEVDPDRGHAGRAGDPLRDDPLAASDVEDRTRAQRADGRVDLAQEALEQPAA